MNYSEMLFNRDEKIIKIIEEKDKEIDKLTAESTEWEERTYHWQDKVEKYQIVLDKIKEYIQSLGTQDGMIKDYMIDKNIKETILELLEEIE